MESERDAGDHEEIVNWRFSQKCEKKAQYLFCSDFETVRLVHNTEVFGHVLFFDRAHFEYRHRV